MLLLMDVWAVSRLGISWTELSEDICVHLDIVSIPPMQMPQGGMEGPQDRCTPPSLDTTGGALFTPTSLHKPQKAPGTYQRAKGRKRPIPVPGASPFICFHLQRNFIRWAVGFPSCRRGPRLRSRRRMRVTPSPASIPPPQLG